ncbi:MAG: hypothetical protein K2X39_07185, partial [Silvanigrellaceae bacterium]|nr:hypothetical protein [Silvanigrellaceae bacterium]
MRQNFFGISSLKNAQITKIKLNKLNTVINEKVDLQISSLFSNEDTVATFAHHFTAPSEELLDVFYNHPISDEIIQGVRS